MGDAQRFRSVVDETLGTLFPAERKASGVIRARINKLVTGAFECDLNAPDEYVPEIVQALDARLAGWNYVLTIRTL